MEREGRLLERERERDRVNDKQKDRRRVSWANKIEEKQEDL